MVLTIAGCWLSRPVNAQSDSTQSPGQAPVPPLVQGRVTELVGGKPVPLVGATVQWLNTSIGAITNAEGHFQLPYHPASTSLVVSYVGYQTDTVAVANPAVSVAVTLRNTRTLQEVTVSGSPGHPN